MISFFLSAILFTQQDVTVIRGASDQDLVPSLATPPWLLVYMAKDDSVVKPFNSLVDTKRYEFILVKHNSWSHDLAKEAIEEIRRREKAYVIMPFQVGRRWSNIPLNEIVMVTYNYDPMTKSIEVRFMHNKEGDLILGDEFKRKVMRFAPPIEQLRFRGK